MVPSLALKELSMAARARIPLNLGNVETESSVGRQNDAQ